MRTLLLTTLLLSTGTALAAPEDHPPALMFLMRLIDQVPTKAQLMEAGADEDGAVLAAIAKDAALQRYPRMRAAGSLGLFDNDASRTALAALLDDPALDDHEVKIQALSALVWLEGERALPRLGALLLHPHPELRAAAQRQLDRMSVRKGL